MRIPVPFNEMVKKEAAKRNMTMLDFVVRAVTNDMKREAKQV